MNKELIDGIYMHTCMDMYAQVNKEVNSPPQILVFNTYI